MSYYAPQQQTFNDHSNDEFVQLIAILKSQKVLPEYSFTSHVPFFIIQEISIHTHIREVFQDQTHHNLHMASLNSLVSPSNLAVEDDHTVGAVLQPQTMTFAQICLYKILPCPKAGCSHRTREVVTHNQYKDAEYECPFYHHDKDKRRNIVTSHTNEEFVYKANYFEQDKHQTDHKDKYSQNYFESMFHPLYYKMFRCKRTHCNSHRFCPFYHHEDEKKAWNEVFSSFMQKDRVKYVKDKQKYYDSISPLNTQRQCYSENQSPCSSSGLRIYRNSRANDSQGSPKTATSQFSTTSQRTSEASSAKIQRSTTKSYYEKAKVSSFYDESSSISAQLKSNPTECILSSRMVLKDRIINQ